MALEGFQQKGAASKHLQVVGESENRLLPVATKADDVNRPYSEEYRNVVRTTLDRVEALIPDVKKCADSTGQINELAGQRDILNYEFASQHATLGPEELKNLQGRIRELNRQIDDLCKPLPETEKKIFAFVTELEQVLMSCPLEKSFVEIRSELRQLGLMNISKASARLSFSNSYRDLLIVRQRLREMNSLPNRGASNRKSVPLRIPPDTNWADVSIRFLSDIRIQISVLDRPFEPLNYAEAGFEDSRNEVPNVAWRTLCKLAVNSGELQRSREPGAGRKQVVRLEKSVEAIRKGMKQLFGIEEDPFFPYREMGRYRSKFKISFPKSEHN